MPHHEETRICALWTPLTFPQQQYDAEPSVQISDTHRVQPMAAAAATMTRAAAVVKGAMAAAGVP